MWAAADLVPGGKLAGAAAALSKFIADFVKWLRAAGNGSVWTKEPRQRGRDIHEMLGENLPYGWKTVDSFHDGVVTSIKSVDLRAASYQDAGRLKSRLNGYVDKVSAYKGGRRGQTVISPRDIKQRVLLVAIPHGASSAQHAAMADVFYYGAKRNVVVNFVVIK